MTLAAAGVSAGFGDGAVLRDVSVEVSPGEVVTVVGPSGTGKTTLLRLLAAFREPAAGAVTWDGDDVWALPEDERLAVRRRASVVFQEASLFNATVRANVAYGRRVRKPWSRRVRSRLSGLVGSAGPSAPVRAALETVGMAGAADRNALSLSGGEAQRVAFARAVAVEPAVMLLDEPTSNLDPRNTAIIEDAVLDARDRGVGVMVATHDMHQAERVSDRVGFLLGGRLVETGPPERIFEAPTDPRTEQFVNGELVYEDDGSAPAERAEGGAGRG